MNVVLLKDNNYLYYNINNLNGYTFYPRKNISNLVIINDELLKLIIYIKVNRMLEYINKVIKLMINSNATIISDCVMMEEEIYKLINIINNKYINYLESDNYSYFIKSLYELNMELDLKKRIIDN